jgi:hypothetical protein
MSALRYKTLLSYLPGMASVVNTFQSPQVQNAVYEKLIEALEAKLQSEGIGPTELSASPRKRERGPVAPIDSTEVTHDLVEGDSIHGETPRVSMSSSRVF